MVRNRDLPLSYTDVPMVPESRLLAAEARAAAAEEREREAIQAIDVLIHVSPENMALTAESTGEHVAAWEAVRTLVRTRSAR